MPSRYKPRPTPCSQCEVVVSSKSSLKHHMMAFHTFEKPQKCDYCSKRFVTASQLKRHVTLVHLKNGIKLRCKVVNCGKEFSLKQNLLDHTERVHLKKRPKMKFQCIQCDKVFSSKSRHKYHVMKHAGIFFTKCDICGAGFTSTQGLTGHKIISDGLVYDCDKCQQQLCGQRRLNNHKKKYHPIRIKVWRKRGPNLKTKPIKIIKIKPKTPSAPWKCYFCGEIQTKNGFNSHIRSHTGEKFYQCPLCPIWKTKNSLQPHILRLHVHERSYSCKYCTLPEFQCLFKSSKLKSHVRKAHPDKIVRKKSITIHKCELCDRILKTGSSLRKHVQFVHKNLRNPCPIDGCELSFKWKRALLIHTLEVHNKVQLLSCYFCDKDFPISRNLECHLGSHTLEKPYKCEKCGRKFTWKGVMQRCNCRN